MPHEEFGVSEKDEMPQLEGLIASWINVTFPLSVKLEEFFEKSFEEAREHLTEKIRNAYEAKRKAGES